jgi:septation ring formation regulator EzrA
MVVTAKVITMFTEFEMAKKSFSYNTVPFKPDVVAQYLESIEFNLQDLVFEINNLPSAAKDCEAHLSRAIKLLKKAKSADTPDREKIMEEMAIIEKNMNYIRLHFKKVVDANPDLLK